MIDRVALAERGHASAPLLDHDELAELRRIFEGLGLDEVPSFFASANDLDRRTAASVHRDLLAVVGPRLEAALPGHRPFLASFLAKAPHDGAQISFHQDLTYTDERHHRAIVAWIPLDAVDHHRGALAVVTGSHRWTRGSRPGGPLPLPTEPLQDAFASQAELLVMGEGDVVVYDAATVHGSPPNRADEARVAVGVALVPEDAPLVHVHQDELGTTCHQVDGAYYLDQGLRQRPVGYPAYPIWADPVVPGDFEQAS